MGITKLKAHLNEEKIRKIIYNYKTQNYLLYILIHSVNNFDLKYL